MIRLPETIHGGSGLIAKKVKSIDSFDPLTDAIAFDSEIIKISIKEDTQVFDLMDSKWGPYKLGSIQELNDYAAIYLLLKGKADIISVN